MLRELIYIVKSYIETILRHKTTINIALKLLKLVL